MPDFLPEVLKFLKSSFPTKDKTRKCLKAGHSFTLRLFFFFEKAADSTGKRIRSAAQLPLAVSQHQRGPHHQDFHRPTGTGQEPTWKRFPLTSQVAGLKKLLLSLAHFPLRTKIKLSLVQPLSADYFPFRKNQSSHRTEGVV